MGMAVIIVVVLAVVFFVEALLMQVIRDDICNLHIVEVS